MATATKSRSPQPRPARPRKSRTADFPIRRTVRNVVKRVRGVLPAMGRMFSGEISLEFKSLHDLFIRELQDLYSAEHQLLKALPKMAEAAHSTALRDAFQSHLRETKGQVERLDAIFKELKLDAKGHKCQAMEGLIAEGSEWMGEHADPGVKDAGLIAAAQRVEHYEMAGYGCVRTYAQLLGHSRVAKLLQTTLNEEGAADKKLTQLSHRINVQAEHLESHPHGKRSKRST